MISIFLIKLLFAGATKNRLRHFRLLLLLLLAVGAIHYQANAQKSRCSDEVHLKGGTLMVGKIIAWQPGDTLTIETWSGLTMKIAPEMLEKVTQRCPKRFLPGKKSDDAAFYTFRERGWYHATRAAALIGVEERDFTLQHSSGYKINRWLGIGLGVGIENLRYLRTATIPTYPLFMEVRGYLNSKNVSPFYVIGGGYAFVGKEPSTITNRWWQVQNEDWKGGWMAQAQVGYRCGNHFFLYSGLRLQRKSVYWEGINIYGTDRFLHKRLEIGLGLLL